MDTGKLAAEIRRAVEAEKDVVGVYLAGSAATGEMRPESDIDVVVAVKKRRADTADRIYSLIREIKFPRDLDLTVVDKNSSPLFLFQVVSKGRRIYESKELTGFEAEVLHGYYDTAHLRNIYFFYLKDKFPRHYAN